MKAKSSPISVKELFNEKYKIKEKKGSGGSAKAFVVVVKETKREYIAKLVDNNDYFQREVSILSTLKGQNNPNIIRIMDSGRGYIDRINHPKEEMNYIILEYAANRELFDFVIYVRQGFGELFGKVIFSKILNGMRCIHHLNIAHKDLSLSNVFLDENFNPKIGDFGAANYNQNNFTEYFANRDFAAPEIINNKPYNGQKADIFSLGAILISLVYGIQGFKRAIKTDPQYSLIIKGTNESIANYWHQMDSQINEQISQGFKDLYLRMVSENPDTRPTIQDILNDPWITSLQNIDMQATNNLLRNNFEGRKNKARIKVAFEIKLENQKDDDDESEIKSHTRALEGDDLEFNSTKKPKQIPDDFNEKFTIKIKDYTNANYLMNFLFYKLRRDKYNIEANKDKFKIDIIIEEGDEDIEMKIKLYEFKEGLILKFIRRKGSRIVFFEKFKEIYELTKNII